MSLPDSSAELAALREPGVEIAQFNAAGVVLTVGPKLTVPGTMQIASGTGLQINGSFPAETTDAILQALLDGGGTVGATLVIGGASGVPTITPEIDQITVTGLPATGDGLSISVGGGSPVFDVYGDDSMDFASSAWPIIGVQDGPTTDQIAALVSDYINSHLGYGTTATVSGSGITLTCLQPSAWPISMSSLFASLTNSQTGIDRVAALAALGNTITTN